MTTTNLMSFNYDNLTIHSELINNEPWFIADEICKALGYKITRKAITDHVDNEDDLKRIGLALDGKQRKIHWINESGLYALIFGSKLPSAKNFKHWVTHEVLPSIRKTGQYSVKEHKEQKQLTTTVKVPALQICRLHVTKDLYVKAGIYHDDCYYRLEDLYRLIPDLKDWRADNNETRLFSIIEKPDSYPVQYGNYEFINTQGLARYLFAMQEIEEENQDEKISKMLETLFTDWLVNLQQVKFQRERFESKMRHLRGDWSDLND